MISDWAEYSNETIAINGDKKPSSMYCAKSKIAAPCRINQVNKYNLLQHFTGKCEEADERHKY